MQQLLSCDMEQEDKVDSKQTCHVSKLNTVADFFLEAEAQSKK